MFSHTHITRDACFPSVIHVSPAHFTSDAFFLDCSATLKANIAIANVHYIHKDQVQVKHNEAIATGVYS